MTDLTSIQKVIVTALEQIYRKVQERTFEEIYRYTHLTEDTSPAYAEGLHAAIRRNGGFNNFNFTSFNNSRIPLRKKTWAQLNAVIFL